MHLSSLYVLVRLSLRVHAFPPSSLPCLALPFFAKLALIS